MTLRYTHCQYLGTQDPYPHRTKQPSRRRPMPHNALQHAHTMLFLLTFYELPPTRAHSPAAWRKFKQLVNTIVPLSTLSPPNGKRKFWIPQWHIAPWRPMNFVSRLDHTGNIADSPNDKKQSRHDLVRDEVQKQDFANLSLHVSPGSSGQLVDSSLDRFLPHMCHASRASRPCLAVGMLRILCNDLCTDQRFHTEGEEQRCRAG